MFDELCVVLPEEDTHAMIDTLNSLIRAYHQGKIDTDVLVQVNTEMGVKFDNPS